MGRNSSGLFAGGALSAALMTGILLIDHVGMAGGLLLIWGLVVTAVLAMGATLAFALNAWSRVRGLEQVVEALRDEQGAASEVDDR